MKETDFKVFKAKLLENKAVPREYEALNPKYEIIEPIIARGNEMPVSQRKLVNIIFKINQNTNDTEQLG